MTKIRVRQEYGTSARPMYSIYLVDDPLPYAVCSDQSLNDWLRRAWAHAQWRLGLTGVRGVK